MQPCATLPRVAAFEVRHQTTQEEIKVLRTRDSVLDVSRNPPIKNVGQGGHVGSRGLVMGDCTHERFVEGVVPTGNPRGRLWARGATVVAAHQYLRHYCLH